MQLKKFGSWIAVLIIALVGFIALFASSQYWQGLSVGSVEDLGQEYEAISPSYRVDVNDLLNNSRLERPSFSLIEPEPQSENVVYLTAEQLKDVDLTFELAGNDISGMSLNYQVGDGPSFSVSALADDNGQVVIEGLDLYRSIGEDLTVPVSFQLMAPNTNQPDEFIVFYEIDYLFSQSIIVDYADIINDYRGYLLGINVPAVPGQESLNQQEIACRALATRTQEPFVLFDPDENYEYERELVVRTNDPSFFLDFQACAPTGFLNTLVVTQEWLDREIGTDTPVVRTNNFDPPNDDLITLRSSEQEYSFTLNEGRNRFEVDLDSTTFANDVTGVLIVNYVPDNTPPADTEKPQIRIIEAQQVNTEYVILGRVTDNVGIRSFRYTLNGGTAETIDLEDGGYFAVSIELNQIGRNQIDLGAVDAAGNRDIREFVGVLADEVRESEVDVEIEYDDDNPLEGYFHSETDLDFAIVNLYQAGSSSPVLNAFQHCRRGTVDGCLEYVRDELPDGRYEFDISQYAFALEDARYRYKVVVGVDGEYGTIYSDYFRIDPDDYPFLGSGAGLVNPQQPCYYYFIDVNGQILTPAQCNSVAFVRERGIFFGVPGPQEGQYSFEPFLTLRRDQLAASAVRFGQFPPAPYEPARDGDLGFVDLRIFVNDPGARWFMDAFKQAIVYGGQQILQGTGGLMEPLREITVAEAYKVIIETAVVSNRLKVPRPPIDQTKSPWWTDYDIWFAQLGLPQIGPNGNQPIVRVQVADFFAALYARGLIR